VGRQSEGRDGAVDATAHDDDVKRAAIQGAERLGATI
jgi:hypothetical protein